MAYQGRFKPKNISKYKGDASKVVFRSLWERNAFRYLDENPAIVSWNSEEIVIPYKCKSDGRAHRYFPDLWFKTIKGKEFLIEIKPDAQTKEPRIPAKKTHRFLTEVLTYAKNTSKWDAAEVYCAKRNWTFQIWTEHSLKKLGIKTLKRLPPVPRKPRRRKK
jgi:hypothetical protein